MCLKIVIFVTFRNFCRAEYIFLITKYRKLFHHVCRESRFTVIANGNNECEFFEEAILLANSNLINSSVNNFGAKTFHFEIPVALLARRIIEYIRDESI